jgi:hydrogenase expression/formation protein HypC
VCLAIPGKIIEFKKEDKDIAIVDYGGLKKEANISLVDAKVGDYVLVHVGFAIKKVDEKFARETYSLLSDVKL